MLSSDVHAMTGTRAQEFFFSRNSGFQFAADRSHRSRDILLPLFRVLPAPRCNHHAVLHRIHTTLIVHCRANHPGRLRPQSALRGAHPDRYGNVPYRQSDLLLHEIHELRASGLRPGSCRIWAASCNGYVVRTIWIKWRENQQQDRGRQENFGLPVHERRGVQQEAGYEDEMTWEAVAIMGQVTARTVP